MLFSRGLVWGWGFRCVDSRGFGGRAIFFRGVVGGSFVVGSRGGRRGLEAVY